MQVNYIAPADQTGYASAAKQYIQALCAAGVSVFYQPLLPGSSLGLWYGCAGPNAVPAELRARCASQPFTDGITVLHAVPEYYEPLRRWLSSNGVHGPVAGMTVWETTRVPRHWPALLQNLDAVIVPSAWNQQVFRNSGVCIPVFVVPHMSEFHGKAPDEARIQSVRDRLQQRENRFVFYNIGTWSARKGNDLLVQAFQHAFPRRDDVVLILKNPATRLSPPGSLLRKAWRMAKPYPMEKARRAAESFHNIVSVEADWPACDIAALHALGDCYVSCTRGEGWGIGMYEAAWFGKPVLAPSEGGHRAYLLKESEYGLVPGRRRHIPARDRDRSYTGDQQWVDTDVAAMAERMQVCIAEPEAFHSAADTAARATRLRFSDEAITTSLVDALQTLNSRHATLSR